MASKEEVAALKQQYAERTRELAIEYRKKQLPYKTIARE